MEKKMYAYWLDDEWIELLDSLTGLERTTKNYDNPKNSYELFGREYR